MQRGLRSRSVESGLRGLNLRGETGEIGKRRIARPSEPRECSCGNRGLHGIGEEGFTGQGCHGLRNRQPGWKGKGRQRCGVDFEL